MYNVEIITGRRFPFNKFPKFKQVSAKKYKATKLTKQEAKQYVRKARLRFYTAYWFDEKWDRGRGYKKKWILKNPAEEYHCVYCNRKIPYNSITLDHVVPIYAAKQSRVLQKILEARKFENIDDERNLVPSCYACNKLKGKSTSFFWSIRAFLGRYKAYWFAVYTFIVLLIVAVIYLIMKARGVI